MDIPHPFKVLKRSTYLPPEKRGDARTHEKKQYISSITHHIPSTCTHNATPQTFSAGALARTKQAVSSQQNTRLADVRSIHQLTSTQRGHKTRKGRLNWTKRTNPLFGVDLLLCRLVLLLLVLSVLDLFAVLLAIVVDPPTSLPLLLISIVRVSFLWPLSYFSITDDNKANRFFLFLFVFLTPREYFF